MNGEFLAIIRTTIAKRANERCTLCKISTSKPNTGDPNRYISLGEAAHIFGARPAVHNRYDGKMSDGQRSSIDNAIWLCRSCHKTIDSDDKTYTADFLKEQKRIHEENVTLGNYDIQWKDYIQLKERIEVLKKLIFEKEEHQALREQINHGEITALKLELERSQTEKSEIEQQYELLKRTAEGFASGSDEIKAILSNIEKGEFGEAKRKLDYLKLKDEEQFLARKYLLRANIDELERNFDHAEENYLRASQISNNQEFFEAFVSYLTRRGKASVAYNVCLRQLEDENNLDAKIWLNTALAEISSQLYENEQVISYLNKAKQLIESYESLTVDDSIVLATIVTGLGIAHKNLGNYDLALETFQDSLNAFFQASVKHGIIPSKELGDLHVNVAGIYLVNNDPQTALTHFSAAEVAYKESNGYLQILIVGLNSVEAFTHHKIRNYLKARQLINEVVKGCEEGFSLQPLVYLKYLAGALQKSAILHTIEGDNESAKNEIQQAIQLYEGVIEVIGVIDESVLMALYSAFAEVQRLFGQQAISLLYYQKAIDLAFTMPDSVHEKHLNLAAIYAMRAEIITNKVEIRENLQNALRHILRCNFDKVLMARVWKLRIEEQLKLLDANEIS